MSSEPRPRLVETLVSWMAPQVMVFMGKVMNPLTGKVERDLPSARALIDLLAELEEKTSGRLEDDEKRLLQKTLTELRLNYLDEIGKPEPPRVSDAADSETGPEADDTKRADSVEAHAAPGAESAGESSETGNAPAT